MFESAVVIVIERGKLDKQNGYVGSLSLLCCALNFFVVIVLACLRW